MADETSRRTGLIHAGTGTGMALVQLSVLFPGLLPLIGLVAVFLLVVLLPLLVIGLVATVLAAPLAAAWLLAKRARARH